MTVSHPSIRTIALMDSHPLTLSGLSTFIKSVDPTCDIRIKEANLGKIAEALMYQSVDILITDLQSAVETPLEGITLLLRLVAQCPDLHVVVYTFGYDHPALWKLLNDQKFSVIARGESMSETEALFKKVLIRQRVLSPKVCSALANMNKKKETAILSLTRSEIDVLRHLYNGRDMQQLAIMKHKSIKTISAHKCNAMRKLGVKTDSELFTLLGEIFS